MRRRGKRANIYDPTSNCIGRATFPLRPGASGPSQRIPRGHKAHVPRGASSCPHATDGSRSGLRQPEDSERARNRMNTTAQVRSGAPHPTINRPSLHRFTYCPEYYSDTIRRDLTFFGLRRADRVVIGHDVWIGHAVIVLPESVWEMGRCWRPAPWSPATWRPTPSSAACRGTDLAAFQ
jgi:hypothetical protein